MFSFLNFKNILLLTKNLFFGFLIYFKTLYQIHEKIHRVKLELKIISKLIKKNKLFDKFKRNFEIKHCTFSSIQNYHKNIWITKNIQNLWKKNCFHFLRFQHVMIIFGWELFQHFFKNILKMYKSKNFNDILSKKIITSFFAFFRTESTLYL